MLTLQRRTSRTLTVLLVLAHLVSVALVWIMPFHAGVQFVTSLLLVASCLFHFWRDCLLIAPRAIVGLRFDQEYKCSYQLRGGEWFEAKLLGSSLVTPWLSVLNCRPDPGRSIRSIVLFPDSIDVEDYRKLRVLLHWGNHDNGN